MEANSNNADETKQAQKLKEPPCSAIGKRCDSRIGRVFSVVIECAGWLAIAASVITSLNANDMANPGNYLPGLAGLALVVGARRYCAWRAASLVGWRRALRMAVLGIAVCVAAAFCAFLAVNEWAAHEEPSGRDVVIVLGAGLRGERIMPALKARIDRAFAYAMANEHAMILVSGGQGRDELITEASAMAAELERMGFPSYRILREDRSTSTQENFAFSKVILDDFFDGQPYKVVFVTQRFHLLRAGRTARLAGFSEAEGLAAEMTWTMAPQAYSREFAAWSWLVLLAITRG